MGQVQRAAVGSELFGATLRTRMLRVSGLVLIIAAATMAAALSLGAWSGADAQPGAVEAPALTVADDYGTRHSVRSIAAPLTVADDYGTRHSSAAAASILGPLDDYGTRHAPVGAQLSERDDFGTRQSGQ